MKQIISKKTQETSKISKKVKRKVLYVMVCNILGRLVRQNFFSTIKFLCDALYRIYERLCTWYTKRGVSQYDYSSQEILLSFNYRNVAVETMIERYNYTKD